jgi:hypothetical protein
MCLNSIFDALVMRCYELNELRKSDTNDGIFQFWDFPVIADNRIDPASRRFLDVVEEPDAVPVGAEPEPIRRWAADDGVVWV